MKFTQKSGIDPFASGSMQRRIIHHVFKQFDKEKLAEKIKRRAKVIKKEKAIKHHEALELASVEAGFAGWQDFLSTQE